MRRMRSILVAVVVAVVAVAAVAACSGGDADPLCPDGFDAPATLVDATGAVGLGGDAYTLVYAGRVPDQLVYRRDDYAGNVLFREEELTPAGYDASLVRFSGSGNHVAWLEPPFDPVRLRVARITPEGTLADVVTAADRTGTSSYLSNFALADAGADTVAALWGDGADMFLTPITAGQALAPTRIGPHYAATMIATRTELAIGFAADGGAVLDRRAFDGTPLAPPLVVAPGAPTFNGMCWDDGVYKIVFDAIAIAYVRTDGRTASEPRTISEGDAGFPAILCHPDGGPSLVAWTQVLTRTPTGNVETSQVVFRNIDRDGAPLDAPRPITTRTDALNVYPRLHAALDQSVVAAWDEYSTDAPQGIRLVAARCTP